MMAASLLPLGLVVAFGSALALRVMMTNGIRNEAQTTPASRSEMNRDIERRLDLVVNGPSPGCGGSHKGPARIAASVTSLNLPHPQPCSSPERWRETP